MDRGSPELTSSRRGASEDRSRRACLRKRPVGGVVVAGSGRRQGHHEPTEREPGRRRERRHFDETYKRHAVELTLRGDRGVKEIARELGVTGSMLYEWRRIYAPKPTVSGPAPCSLEEAQEEITRLRAEVVRLREPETILKKSPGILSEPPGSGMPGSTR